MYVPRIIGISPNNESINIYLIIHLLGVLLLSSIFVSFCLICLISFWFLNFLSYPPSNSRKALPIVFIGLNLDSFLLFIVMCC